MHRRRFLTMAAAASAVAWRPDAVAAAAAVASLRARAAAKGLRFGCAVKSGDLAADEALAAAVTREAGVLVPEYELKRNIVQPTPGGYDFSGSDRLVAFATAHGQAMRGHAFVWYAANPPWLEAALRSGTTGSAQKRALLTGYITAALARYKGRIGEWDICNEVVAPEDGAPDGMRTKNIWHEALGERHIDLAFHTARRADPAVILYLNDFGLESVGSWQQRKRTATLKLLDRLKARNVPIDGFGIQAHMKPYKERFDQRVFADFLHALNGYGLKLSLTEVDFMDRGGPTDPARRDADMAAAAKSLLDVALDNRAVESVLTWGLTDRHSWLTSPWVGDRWPAGQFARGLPLDVDLREKPLYRAIATALDHAPRR